MGRHTIGIAVNERFSPFGRIDYLAEDTRPSDWSWLGLSKVKIRKIRMRSVKIGIAVYRKIDFLEENLRNANFIDSPEVFTFTSKQCCSLARSLRKKLVVTVIETIPKHYTSFVPPYAWNTRYVLNRADLLVALTERAKKYLLSIGAQEDKVVVIPQGVDIDRFHPADGPVDHQEKVRLLVVSQLHRGRGIIECLEAFRRLCRTHRNVELWVVGEGALGQFVETYARKYPVRMFGHVPYQSLPQIYRQATIFCLPGKDGRVLGVKTFEDGQFTISVLEAMASGLPVVVTDSGAYKQIVEPHNAFVAQGSVDSLYQALLALTEDEAGRRSIGRTNRIWMSKHFDGALQCRKYAQALSEL